jgi:hypothetical protein
MDAQELPLLHLRITHKRRVLRELSLGRASEVLAVVYGSESADVHPAVLEKTGNGDRTIDAPIEAVLKRLARRRGQTKSEVTRDATGASRRRSKGAVLRVPSAQALHWRD